MNRPQKTIGRKQCGCLVLYPAEKNSTIRHKSLDNSVALRRQPGSSDRKRCGERLSSGDLHLGSPDLHLGSDASPESGDQKIGTDLNVILAFSEMLLFSCFLFSAVVKSGQEAYKKRGRRNRRWRLRADKTVVFHMRQKNPTENIKEEASCPSSNSP